MSANHCYKIGTRPLISSPEDDASTSYNEFGNDLFDDVWFSLAGAFVLNNLKHFVSDFPEHSACRLLDSSLHSCLGWGASYPDRIIGVFFSL